MFQFTAFPLHALWIYAWIPTLYAGRFPHSDTRGSQTVCVSPRLFAAVCVLLRLMAPRHSPFALSCLTFFAWPALAPARGLRVLRGYPRRASFPAAFFASRLPLRFCDHHLSLSALCDDPCFFSVFGFQGAGGTVATQDAVLVPRCAFAARGVMPARVCGPTYTMRLARPPGALQPEAKPAWRRGGSNS